MAKKEKNKKKHKNGNGKDSLKNTSENASKKQKSGSAHKNLNSVNMTEPVPAKTSAPLETTSAPSAAPASNGLSSAQVSPVQAATAQTSCIKNVKQLDTVCKSLLLFSKELNHLLSTAFTIDGHTLHAAELEALRVLAANEPINLTGLAHLQHMTKSGALKTTVKLQEKGLISKEKSSQNSREIYMRLTPEGKSAHDQIDARLLERLSPIIHVLQTSDAQSLSVLETSLAALNQALEPADK